MTIEIHVEGMTCGHCVSAVTRALQKVPGVERAEVSLEKGRALVTGSAAPAALVEAVREEGYEARPA